MGKPDPTGLALRKVKQIARAEVTRRKSLAKFLAKPAFEQRMASEDEVKKK